MDASGAQGGRKVWTGRARWLRPAVLLVVSASAPAFAVPDRKRHETVVAGATQTTEATLARDTDR